MAFYRQLLVLTVPSVAVLFGIYWYRRKRGCAKSDPGGKNRNSKTLKKELEEAAAATSETKSTPSKCNSAFNVIPKSAPIDIVPNGTHSNRTSPIRLTDKQLDYEIEKAKSHKYYDMEFPLKKTSKENTPASERRVKSLPAKSSTTHVNKPPDENSINTTFSVKRETNASCLTEQILNCKVNDENTPCTDRLNEESTNSSLSNSKSPVPPVQEVIQEEIKKEVISLTTDCKPKLTTTDNNSKSCRKTCKNGKENKIEKTMEQKFQENSVENNSSIETETENPHVDEKLEISFNKDSLDAAAPVELETRSADRDSANHSPADAMLASPCISNFSDNHSEGSNDSGKGCSESPSPPPTSAGDPPAPPDVFVRHQFVLPQSVVGLVIGNKRSFLNKMNETTCAKVYIRTHPDTTKLKICAIEGSQHDVDIVLDMIRQRLPEKRFPNISLKDISQELCEREFSLLSDCYYLNLVEGVNNDTIVSCYVSPWQLFLQQPTHPTYPSLHILHTLMGVCYQDQSVPPLPQQVTEGMICAAPTANNWYRTQVISTNLELNSSLVKLVDFGGFMNVNNSLLKQIRSDFMMLPFQATEVQLAHIAPVEAEWSPEAVQIMAGLTSGQLLQAQVVGYNEVGLPLVYLYLTLGPQNVISLNQELVVRGLAQWVEQEC